MKTGLSVAAVLVALAVSAPAFAQTEDNALLQSKLAQCRTIVDPGLKAQCMEQARSMMRSQQTQQQQMQQARCRASTGRGSTPTCRRRISG